jgi:Putative adhesin
MVALPVLGATAACTPIEYDTLTDGATRDQPITEVRVSGGSGDVSVLSDPSVKGVNLIRTVRYRGAKPGSTYRFDGDVLYIDTACGNMCGASYEVRVPPRGSGSGVAVNGSNSSGNITVRGEGAVDVSVSSGDIEITDIDASVKAKTSSGNVTLVDIGGNVAIIVTSGDVKGRDLRGATSNIQSTSGNVTLDLPGTGDMTAHATSGDIDVTVPDGMCRVHADANSGDTSVKVVQGTGHLLDVTTTSGNITVKPA